MPPADHMLAFLAAGWLMIVIPGPSVLFVISRGMVLGRRAAVATVVGNAAGVYVQVVALVLGLGAALERWSGLHDALRLVGAAYIVVLGVRALRHRRALAAALGQPVAAMPIGRILREGFIVGVTNPKLAVFFTAVLPQFTDPARGHLSVQLLVLGSILVAIALISDSMWGLAAGTARDWLGRSPRRLAALGGTGGLVMIGLGVRLAMTGRRD